MPARHTFKKLVQVCTRSCIEIVHVSWVRVVYWFGFCLNGFSFPEQIQILVQVEKGEPLVSCLNCQQHKIISLCEIWNYSKAGESSEVQLVKLIQTRYKWWSAAVPAPGRLSTASLDQLSVDYESTKPSQETPDYRCKHMLLLLISL